MFSWIGGTIVLIIFQSIKIEVNLISWIYFNSLIGQRFTNKLSFPSATSMLVTSPVWWTIVGDVLADFCPRHHLIVSTSIDNLFYHPNIFVQNQLVHITVLSTQTGWLTVTLPSVLTCKMLKFSGFFHHFRHGSLRGGVYVGEYSPKINICHSLGNVNTAQCDIKLRPKNLNNQFFNPLLG